MPRSTEKVFTDHAQAVAARDLDAVLADYAPDAIYIAPDGVHRGHTGTREAYTEVFRNDMQNFRRTAYAVEGDVLYLAWTASKAGAELTGTDTFVVADGLITAHTVFIIGSPAD